MFQSVVAGLIAGGVYALLGVCVVLLYRMVGVLNLAAAAIGAFGAYVMLAAFQAGWPLPLAVGVGLLSGGVVGALLGGLMSRFFAEANVSTKSSVTIALLIGLLTIGNRLFGDSPRQTPNIFGDASFAVGGVTVSVTTLIVLVLAGVVALLVTLFLGRTRLGVQLRALSERPTAAELLGVRARSLSVLVWAVTGVLAALAIMLVAPTRTANFLSLSLLVLPALAAALVGSFRSFGITIAGGLGLGVLESVASLSDTLAPYRTGLGFFVTLAALLWLQRKEVWDAAR